MIKRIKIYFIVQWLAVATLSNSFAQLHRSVNQIWDKHPAERPSFYIIHLRGENTQQHYHNRNLKFICEVASGYFIVANTDIEKFPDSLVVGAANDQWKIPRDEMMYTGRFPQIFSASMLDHTSVDKLRNISGVEILSEHVESKSAIVSVSSQKVFRSLLKFNGVTFISRSQIAVEESPNNFQDLAVNRINYIHHFRPELSGSGMVVSVKEKNIDSTDIDVQNRVLPSAVSDPEVSIHATQIATIIAGAGNSIPSAKGAAWQSTLFPSSFQFLLPDSPDILKNNSVSVQNHSYGTEIENFYGAEAKAYDTQIEADSTTLFVFSSGNSGNQTSTEGVYGGIEGFANLTGNMKMAKNILVVGAHEENFSVSELSSRGPAYDGRLKPDIIAYGKEGTSDAAAVVSGASILLQQFHKNNKGKLPTVDLVKASWIVTADDAGPAGLDYITGHGAINARKALSVFENTLYYREAVQSGESKVHSIIVPEGIKKLRVALAWIDPPANAGDLHALVNDLDLRITETRSKESWLPWVLSHYPDVDSLNLSAVRKADHVNNSEFVSIDNPASGNYEINVSAFSLSTLRQHFYVTYWMDSVGTFKWTYPLKDDAIETGKTIFVRWDNTFAGSAEIYFRIEGGNFELISNTVNLNKGFFQWTTPHTTGRVQLKMRIGSEDFISDFFTVSPSEEVKVEYNCESEGMISWRKIEGVTTYNVFGLGRQYFEKIATVSDTLFKVNKDDLESGYYSVEPVVNDHEGVRSAAYDIETQGVKCYYNNFFAQAGDGSATLTVNLSTRYNVEKIIWEKKVNGVFTQLAESTVSDFKVVYIDNTVANGVTDYRAGIVIKDGPVIHTEISSVYYADDQGYLLFPNPVGLGETLNFLSDADNIYVLFYNPQGELVKGQDITTPLFKFTLTDLNSGLYFYTVFRNATPVKSGKILLR
jgi:hypothetical protein